MGKVFTYQELMDQQVPTLDSFDEVARICGHSINDSPISCGIICGSVIYGHHTVRSDIDCFVQYSEKDEAEVTETLTKLTAVADSLLVPLDFIELTIESAQSPNHAISPSLVRHILCAVENGGLFGDRPSAITDISSLGKKEEASSWIRHKIMMARKGQVKGVLYGPEREAIYLQKLLEAPVSGMRKFLTINWVLGDDSKPAILRIAEENFPDLAVELRRFVDLDNDYTEVVKSYVGNIDEEGYQNILRRIRAEAPAVTNFLRKIGLRIAEAS